MGSVAPVGEIAGGRRCRVGGYVVPTAVERPVLRSTVSR